MTDKQALTQKALKNTQIELNETKRNLTKVNEVVGLVVIYEIERHL